MKIQPNESIEQWSNRVAQYEYRRGLMQLSEGHDISLVMNEMSRRILKKINHYIINSLNNIADTYNAEESTQRYKETYIDRFGPKPDHIKE